MGEIEERTSNVVLRNDGETHTVGRFRTLFGSRPIKNYLEIGVNKGRTFLGVEAVRKVGVDPKFLFDFERETRPGVEFHQTTSDDYFTRIAGRERFDLVFVDGLHTFEQTLRDFCNVLSVVDTSSIIVIDDTVPSDVYSAIPAQKRAVQLRERFGGSGAAWHGDVYKIVAFIHDYFPTLSYVTLMTGGNPQTVVWFDPRTSFKPRFASLAAIHQFGFFDLQDDLRILNGVNEAEGIALVRAALAARV